MPSFPDWLPTTVVGFYDRLAARERVDGINLDPFLDETLEEFYDSREFKAGFAALQIAMESPEMEKAWRAIEKRKDIEPPETLCLFIMNVPSMLSHFDLASDRKSILAWKKFSDDLKSAVDTFVQKTGQSPTNELLREISYIDMTADHWLDEWEELDSVVGQRSASTAKRNYLIRILTKRFLKIYGMPLYDTVASVVAVLLDQDSIGAENVRKLVELQRNRPASRWEQIDPEEGGS